MSLLTAHKILISAALALGVFYGLWEVHRYAAHVIVSRRQHGEKILRGIEPGIGADPGDRRVPRRQRPGQHVPRVEVDRLALHGAGPYRPGNDVGGRKLRARIDVAHETSPLAVHQQRPLAAVVQLMSATPWNITTGRDDDVNGITTDRPAGVGRNTGSDTPLDAVNDLRASVGLDPVPDLESPTFAQVDVRLSRRFSSSNRRTMAEAFFQVFNIFDRFNGGPVEGRITARNFGEPVGLGGPPRTVEVGLRFLN